MAEKLYPDLEDECDAMETDPLGALPAISKPARPPPPRSRSGPLSLDTDKAQAHSPGRQQRNMSLPTTEIQHPQAQSADVVLPSPPAPEEVRWFYLEPGKYWAPFNGYDSLRLEDCYSKLQESRGSSGECEVTVLGDLFEVNLLDKQLKPIYWTGKEPWKILRGVWFEVSGGGEKWYPIEEHECARIEFEHRRRQWREKAQRDHVLQEWAMAGVAGASGTKQQSSPSSQTIAIVNKLALEKYEVLWLADTNVYKLKTDVTAKLWSKLGATIGRGQLYGATKLVRGYKESAKESDRVPPVRHLVFVIHGVGQVMDGSDIVKSAADLRETCEQVAKKHFPDEWAKGRVEFLPVEWRTWLSLDKGVISTITLNSVKMLRSMLNESAVDVMYYLSAKFGPEIMDGLRFQFHKQFSEFTKRHPDFVTNGGTTSLFAHSLGSVMAYDLLHETCAARGVEHEEPPESLLGAQPVSRYESFRTERLSSDESPKALDLKSAGQGGVRFTAGVESSESSLRSDLSPSTYDEPDVSDGAAARLELEQLKLKVAELEKKLGICQRPQGLEFMVDHFFAVGSPLGLFLVMRDHEKMVKKGHMNASSLIPSCVCRRIHNLHHPSDPIAYRLEPLINPIYAQVKPVKIDSTSAKPTKEAVDHAEGPKPEAKVPPSLAATKSSWFSGLWPGSSVKKASVEASKPAYPDKVMDTDKTLRPEDKLKERIDFMLRESLTENSYINSLTAHFSYWTAQDCAKYLLLQIYRYNPQE